MRSSGVFSATLHAVCLKHHQLGFNMSSQILGTELTQRREKHFIIQ